MTSAPIRLRRATEAEAAASNPTLAAGEVGVTTDTHRAKVGDGVTAWNALPYVDATALLGVFDSLTVNDAGAATGDLRAESDTEPNMLLLDASADTLYLGGTTNGLSIGKGGTLKANGTATWFDDLRVEPTVRGTGSKVPTYAAMVGGIYAYQFDDAAADSEKEINFKMQLPHGALHGAPLHLHLHWVAGTTGSAGQKVRWGLEWTRVNINAVTPATTTIYATDPVNPPSTTPTAMTHYLTEFADLDMAGGTLSTMVLGRIFRNSSDAADTYGGTAWLLGIDAHVEMCQLGSNEEFSA